MTPRGSKSFTHFLLGFLAIICTAFVVLVVASQQVPEPSPVDNIALPQ